MFAIAITYWIWIPIEVVFYSINAYFSKQNNEIGGTKNAIAVIGLNLIPLWAFIAPDSNNLAFDGLLYDLIMVITGITTLTYLGVGQKFRIRNWVGAIMVIIGLVIMEIGS